MNAPAHSEKLTIIGGLVIEAMATVEQAEQDFADSPWFTSPTLTQTITLADGSEWAITVARPEKEA